jgi:regulator of nonsense transcripts 1
VNEKKATEFEWSPDKWEPLIQQKEIVSWVARKAAKEEPRSEYSVQEMIRLEEAWKSNPRLKCTDILKRKVVKRLRSVLLKYKSGRQYKYIFEALLTEESKTDRKIKESQTQNNMKITFSHNNGKRYAYFLFGSR